MNYELKHFDTTLIRFSATIEKQIHRRAKELLE